MFQETSMLFGGSVPTQSPYSIPVLIETRKGRKKGSGLQPGRHGRNVHFQHSGKEVSPWRTGLSTIPPVLPRPPSRLKTVSQGGKRRHSSPNLSPQVVSGERESRSLKLLLPPTAWMPALHHNRYRARLRGHDELRHSLLAGRFGFFLPFCALLHNPLSIEFLGTFLH
jgi:hypothetical protein